MKIVYKDCIYEAISPSKPNKTLTKHKTINGGTSIARKQYYKQFTTNKGNVVKVFFRWDFGRELRIDFAVNDSYNNDPSRDFDREILKGVLYVIIKYVKENPPEIISLAFNDEDGNNKTRYDVFKNMLIKNLENYEEFSNIPNRAILLKRKDIETINETYSNENSILRDYMKDSNIDIYNSDVNWAYVNWLKNNYPDELVEFNSDDMFDTDEFNNKYPEILKEFIESIKNNRNDEYASAVGHSGYTKAHMSLVSNQVLPRNTWLIHFSNDVDDIVRMGFKFGADDVSDLALTTHYSNETRKKNPGYNFAFALQDRTDWKYASESQKYGKGAVIFQSSGVRMDHYGDSEVQTVFYGPNVKEFVYVTFNSNGEWCVISNVGKKIYCNEDFEKVVYWVVNNYQQYKNKIVWRLNENCA